MKNCVTLHGFYRAVLPSLQQKYLKYALSQEKFGKKTRVLDIFAGDLEVRLGKNNAVILSFY